MGTCPQVLCRVQILATFLFAIPVTNWHCANGCKLNVPAFLRYLELEKFYHVQCIYIPCGKTKGLYVDDIRNVCPDVLTIIHSKWLMYNGRVEEVLEGTARHQCYRVYRHDKEFTEGVNVWVKWIWDNKYKLVAESHFVTPSSDQRRSRLRTSFLQY